MQADISRDLGHIMDSLGHGTVKDPYALTLETPNDLARRRRVALERERLNQNQPPEGGTNVPQQEKKEKQAATQAIARRAGALKDEIDFPAFIANLVHGTFDAIVDASIRQMEAFAELISAVAKDLDRFTSENVTENQARDYLAQQHPQDLTLDFTDNQPKIQLRNPHSENEFFIEENSPSWLIDYGLEGRDLTDEFVEEELLPAARRRLGENRLQMLATMVLMGMNRVIVKDGTILAKVKFRAIAQDQAALQYAVSQDPGPVSWGGRGGGVHTGSQMMISTVGTNVQAEAELGAELYGEVKINFVSETLPLDQFVDAAKLALLQRNSLTQNNPVNTANKEKANGSTDLLLPPNTE